MEITAELALWFLGAMTGVFGYFGRQVATKMDRLTEAITNMNANQKVHGKTLEVLNARMTEHTQNIGELFHDQDTIRQNLATLKGEHDAMKCRFKK